MMVDGIAHMDVISIKFFVYLFIFIYSFFFFFSNRKLILYIWNKYTLSIRGHY